MLRSTTAKQAMLFFAFTTLGAVGCQQRSESPVMSAAASKEVTVEISGMSCEIGCAPRAREALESVPGINGVKVDFGRKQGTFAINPAKYDEAAILTALEKEGFTGRIVK